MECGLDGLACQDLSDDDRACVDFEDDVVMEAEHSGRTDKVREATYCTSSSQTCVSCHAHLMNPSNPSSPGGHIKL